MLKLPNDWTRMPGDRLAASLLRQATRLRLQHSAARWLIWAAFDLGFAAKWSESAPHLTLIEKPRFTWRLGDSVCRYLPRVDDWVMHKLTEKSPVPSNHYLLAPPSMRNLLDAGLRQRLKDQAPTVWDLLQFIGLRVDFSSLDARWPHSESMRRFIEAYNTRVMALKHGETLFATAQRSDAPASWRR